MIRGEDNEKYYRPRRPRKKQVTKRIRRGRARRRKKVNEFGMRKGRYVCKKKAT